MTSSARTFSEAVENAITRRLAEAFFARVAEVVSYDTATQTVSAKPLQKDWKRVDEDTEESTSLPILTKVPVVFPGPITFPIVAGDVVLLLFSDRSLDLWKSNGGEADPIDKRNHSMRDAVALPVVYSLNSPRTNIPANAITTHGLTHLGAYDATEPALKGDAFDTYVRSLVSAAANAAAGAVPGAVAPAITAAVTAAMAGITAASAKSSLVKVK